MADGHVRRALRRLTGVPEAGSVAAVVGGAGRATAETAVAPEQPSKSRGRRARGRWGKQRPETSRAAAWWMGTGGVAMKTLEATVVVVAAVAGAGRRQEKGCGLRRGETRQKRGANAGQGDVSLLSNVVEASAELGDSSSSQAQRAHSRRTQAPRGAATRTRRRMALLWPPAAGCLIADPG